LGVGQEDPLAVGQEGQEDPLVVVHQACKWVAVALLQACRWEVQWDEAVRLSWEDHQAWEVREDHLEWAALLRAWGVP